MEIHWLFFHEYTTYIQKNTLLQLETAGQDIPIRTINAKRGDAEPNKTVFDLLSNFKKTILV